MTGGDLYKAKRLTDDDLTAAVVGYLADPTLGPRKIADGISLDIAAAVLASPYATEIWRARVRPRRGGAWRSERRSCWRGRHDVYVGNLTLPTGPICHPLFRSRSGADRHTFGAEREATPMSNRRELYQSPSGDTWSLGREPQNGRAFIIHQPNGPSGGQRSHIELGAFLADGTGRPEQQALLRLIGTLVEVPPFAEPH